MVCNKWRYIYTNTTKINHFIQLCSNILYSYSGNRSLGLPVLVKV